MENKKLVSKKKSKKRYACCYWNSNKFPARFLPCQFDLNRCIIKIGDRYMKSPEGFNVCRKCFTRSKDADIEVQYDGVDDKFHAAVLKKTVAKSDFVAKKNDSGGEEPIVKCKDCLKKFHGICVLYIPQFWPLGFFCENCVKKDSRREPKILSAKLLPKTELSDLIEDRVATLFKANHCKVKIIVRVLANYDENMMVKPQMAERYCNDKHKFPTSFSYKAKSIYAFADMHGKELCFFGMLVNEYGDGCPPPNYRRVYLAYLESDRYLTLRSGLRTLLFQEIIISYLEYAKSKGYIACHIWACPPSKNGDFLFPFRSKNQLIPTQERLQEWYRKLFLRGMSKNVILRFESAYQYWTEMNVQKVTEYAYLDNDHWPDFIENHILKIESRRGQGPEVFADGTQGPRGKPDIWTQLQYMKASGETPPNWSDEQLEEFDRKAFDSKLCQDVAKQMALFEGSFFVVVLQEPYEGMPEVIDDERRIICETMKTRHSFLTMAYKHNWRFDSTRYAFFATASMLHEIFIERFGFHCDNCGLEFITERYHCKICEDFDLCPACYSSLHHEHEMYRFEFKDTSPPGVVPKFPDEEGELVTEHMLPKNEEIAEQNASTVSTGPESMA